jgi:hypothetical protein
MKVLVRYTCVTSGFPQNPQEIEEKRQFGTYGDPDGMEILEGLAG